MSVHTTSGINDATWFENAGYGKSEQLWVTESLIEQYEAEWGFRIDEQYTDIMNFPLEDYENLPLDVFEHVYFYKHLHRWNEKFTKYENPRPDPKDPGEDYQSLVDGLKARYNIDPDEKIPSLAQLNGEPADINLDELSGFDGTGALGEPINEIEFSESANYGWIAGLVIGCLFALGLCYWQKWLCFKECSKKQEYDGENYVRRRLQNRPIFQIWEEPAQLIDGLLSRNDREEPQLNDAEPHDGNYSDAMITTALSMMLSAATLALIYFVYRSVKAYRQGKSHGRNNTGRKLRV